MCDFAPSINVRFHEACFVINLNLASGSGGDVILILWWPFCLQERNNLNSYGRGHNEERLLEIISNQWF